MLHLKWVISECLFIFGFFFLREIVQVSADLSNKSTSSESVQRKNVRGWTFVYINEQNVEGTEGSKDIKGNKGGEGIKGNKGGEGIKGNKSSEDSKDSSNANTNANDNTNTNANTNVNVNDNGNANNNGMGTDEQSKGSDALMELEKLIINAVSGENEDQIVKGSDENDEEDIYEIEYDIEPTDENENENGNTNTNTNTITNTNTNTHANTNSNEGGDVSSIVKLAKVISNKIISEANLDQVQKLDSETLKESTAKVFHKMGEQLNNISASDAGSTVSATTKVVLSQQLTRETTNSKKETLEESEEGKKKDAMLIKAILQDKRERDVTIPNIENDANTVEYIVNLANEQLARNKNSGSTETDVNENTNVEVTGNVDANENEDVRQNKDEAIQNTIEKIDSEQKGISRIFDNTLRTIENVVFKIKYYSLAINSFLRFRAHYVCDSSKCGINARCYKVEEDKEECRCDANYIQDKTEDYFSCIPNPQKDCSIDNGFCDVNAKCSAVGNSINCQCKYRFIGDGIFCVPSSQNHKKLCIFILSLIVVFFKFFL